MTNITGGPTNGGRSLPPQAIGHYEREINSLVESIQVSTATNHSIRETGKVNAYGDPVERALQVGGNVYRLRGEHHSKFLQLTTQIAERKEFLGAISKESLRGLIFPWMVNKFQGLPEVTFAEHVLHALQGVVQKRHIAIPIDMLTIESEFTIGAVEFITFDDKYYESLSRHASTLNDNEKLIMQTSIESMKRQWKGKVCGVVEIWGDEDQSVRLAVDQVARALMMLKFYSPYGIDPRLHCAFGIEGQVHVRSTNALLSSTWPIPDKSVHGISGGIPMFVIRNELLQAMQTSGLRRASMLLQQLRFNELEQLALRCIATFVHGIESRDAQDRLVFTIAAIECLLLGGDKAPIQETVGTRMGYLCAHIAYQRREIKSLLKKATGLRSRYLHHGSSEHDMKVLESLVQHVWVAINNVIAISENLKTPADLYELIDENMLS